MLVQASASWSDTAFGTYMISWFQASAAHQKFSQSQLSSQSTIAIAFIQLLHRVPQSLFMHIFQLWNGWTNHDEILRGENMDPQVLYKV